MAVVKVTQHLCQKQLQSSSLSCSFIITYTRTRRDTHAHTQILTHTDTHATASAWKSFHFFPFYLTGLPEKLVEQIFMKILCSSYISWLLSLSLSLYSLSLSLHKQSQKSRSTLFLVCCLLPALHAPCPPAHWLLPLPRYNDCELAFVCFFRVLKPIPAGR